MSQVVTGSAVSFLAGAIVSLALELAPGLKERWQAWKWKRAAWLVLCLVVPLAWIGLAYFGAPVGFTPDGPFVWEGLATALTAGFGAYYGGQATFAAVRAETRPVGGNGSSDPTGARSPVEPAEVNDRLTVQNGGQVARRARRRRSKRR